MDQPGYLHIHDAFESGREQRSQLRPTGRFDSVQMDHEGGGQLFIRVLFHGNEWLQLFEIAQICRTAAHVCPLPYLACQFRYFDRPI